MKIKSFISLILSLCLFSVLGFSQQKTTSFDLPKLLREHAMNSFNRNISPLPGDPEYKGIRIDERGNYGIAWITYMNFKGGIIEFDVKGKNVEQQSFVGLAFNGKDDHLFESVYFRPFNFQSKDPYKKSHAVQYVSMPNFDWELLREKFPGKYENEINPVPDPNQWFHVKIIIKNPAVLVSVNGSKEVSLAVRQLSDRKEGRIGFFVGNNSGGDFANLKITTMH